MLYPEFSSEEALCNPDLVLMHNKIHNTKSVIYSFLYKGENVSFQTCIACHSLKRELKRREACFLLVGICRN